METPNVLPPQEVEPEPDPTWKSEKGRVWTMLERAEMDGGAGLLAEKQMVADFFHLYMLDNHEAVEGVLRNPEQFSDRFVEMLSSAIAGQPIGKYISPAILRRLTEEVRVSLLQRRLSDPF